MSNEKHFTISSLTYFWSKIRQIIPFFHAFSNALIDRITSTASSTSVPDFTLISQHVVELYEGSSLAGLLQSVQNAINGLNNSLTENYLGGRSTLTDGTDLDTVLTTGIYFLAQSYNYSNMPPTGAWGFLLVLKSKETSTLASQIMIIGGGRIYARTLGSSGTWTAWATWS